MTPACGGSESRVVLRGVGDTTSFGDCDTIPHACEPWRATWRRRRPCGARNARQWRPDSSDLLVGRRAVDPAQVRGAFPARRLTYQLYFPGRRAAAGPRMVDMSTNRRQTHACSETHLYADDVDAQRVGLTGDTLASCRKTGEPHFAVWCADGSSDTFAGVSRLVVPASLMSRRVHASCRPCRG